MANPDARKDRLLVIGAGPVGLGMADALLRGGLPYDHVEARAGVGGNWYEGVFKNTHIISSKRSTAFADYPMPADFPDFPSRTQVQAYLGQFARDRGLLPRIEFSTAVTAARQHADGSWEVELTGGARRLYKGLVVCNGHHWERNWPRYPGHFAGEMIHSKDFFDPATLRDKRVLVIGGGNSGADLACEAARHGACSDISLRSGYWYLPKTVFGRPLTDLPIWNLPVAMQKPILKALVRITIGDYRAYGLERPDHDLFDRHPAFGTEMLTYLRQGRISARPDIARFEGYTVHFKDGRTADYDLVIAATGFKTVFPFLPQGTVGVRDGIAQIYGGAFPASVKNLYLVGTMQVRNGFGALLTPAAALYARLIALQDELQHPVGRVLKTMGFKVPTSNFLDPGEARRMIWFANRLLWLVRLQGRRLQGERISLGNLWRTPPAHVLRDPLAATPARDSAIAIARRAA